MKTIEIPSTDERDALVDLINGAIKRRESALWAAKRACEEAATHDKDTLKEITRARELLTAAEMHETALRHYKAQLQIKAPS